MYIFHCQFINRAKHLKMPFGSGRKSCLEREEVDLIENDKLKVMYKHCTTIISRKVERVRAHLKKCKKYACSIEMLDDNDTEPAALTSRSSTTPSGPTAGPSTPSASCSSLTPVLLDDSERIQRSEFLMSIDIDFMETNNEPSFSLTPSDTSTPMKKKQRSLASFVIKTSAETKDSLDLLVAKYFLCTNTAFKNIENSHFINLMEKLWPGYKPPNRKQLAGPLLDRVYEVMGEIKAELNMNNPSPLVLMQYGWRNTKNEPIIAHSIHNGIKPTLLSIVEPKDNKKTAEYCASLAEDAMKHVEKEFGKEVSRKMGSSDSP